MPTPPLHTLQVIEAMENYIQKRRPPVAIREQLDLSYKIENQSIIIFEIRPRYTNPLIKIECNIAKATFVKTTSTWKVFWMRSDLKWHGYETKKTIKTIDDFIKLVDEDKDHCFWG